MHLLALALPAPPPFFLEIIVCNFSPPPTSPWVLFLFTYLLSAVSGSGILIVFVTCELVFWLVCVCVYSFSELVAFVTFTLYCTRVLHKINFSLPLPLPYLTHPCRLIEVAILSGGDVPKEVGLRSGNVDVVLTLVFPVWVVVSLCGGEGGGNVWPWI